MQTLLELQRWGGFVSVGTRGFRAKTDNTDDRGNETVAFAAHGVQANKSVNSWTEGQCRKTTDLLH